MEPERNAAGFDEMDVDHAGDVVDGLGVPIGTVDVDVMAAADEEAGAFEHDAFDAAAAVAAGKCEGDFHVGTRMPWRRFVVSGVDIGDEAGAGPDGDGAAGNQEMIDESMSELREHQEREANGKEREIWVCPEQAFLRPPCHIKEHAENAHECGEACQAGFSEEGHDHIRGGSYSFRRPTPTPYMGLERKERSERIFDGDEPGIGAAKAIVETDVGRAFAGFFIEQEPSDDYDGHEEQECAGCELKLSAQDED